MNFEENEIKKLIKNSPQKKEIQKAIDHENRVSFHTISDVSDGRKQPYYSKFMSKVKEILPYDKFHRFVQLLETPFTSISVTNDALKNYSRIFDGQNPYYNYEFSSSENKDDFEVYLNDIIQDKHFFRSKGFESLKCGINNILIVDLPLEQISSRPEPYYYFIGIQDVKFIDVNSNGEIRKIIFKCKNRYHAYDGLYYRVYVEKDGECYLISENTHDLGYCPAIFFWSDNLMPYSRIIKKSPFTDSLGNLDKYLKLETFKEHADLYSSFPIIVSIEQDCGFEGCQEGFIKSEERYFVEDTQEYQYRTKTEKCPACEKKGFIGAGTNFITPATEDGGMVQNPVQIVGADVSPLQYLKEKISQLRLSILNDLIGSHSEVTNEQAVNEMQMAGSFENRLTILLAIKKEFERVQKFANSTVARLRYGASFLSASVYYGDEFFLKSLANLEAEYKKNKEDGAPDEELQNIFYKIIQYKYKGNDEMLLRSRILLNLNPEPHKTVEECSRLVQGNAMLQTDFVIKARFNTFISRFEREQTNIVTFGENLDFANKINIIFNQLTQYANEQLGNNNTE